MHRVIVKRPGEPLEVVTWPEITAGRIHEVIGDTFCLAFKISGPDSHALIGFCDDEGLLKGLPINIVRANDGAPIAGPVVVIGADGPDEVGLTEDEVAFFLKMWG